MFVNKYISIYLAFIIILLLQFSDSYSQLEEQNVPKLDLYVNTVFDKENTNSNIYRLYFNNSKDKQLASFVSSQLKKIFEMRLEDLGITKLRIEVLSEQLLPDTLIHYNSYALKNLIFVDDEVNLFIKFSIINMKTKKEVLYIPFKKTLKNDVLGLQENWRILQDSSQTSGLTFVGIQEIASSLCSKIEKEITQWIIRSSVRFRVLVNNFSQIGGDDSYRYLSETLKTMVETELTKSDAILLHSTINNDLTQTTKDETKEKLLFNYIVDGRYVEINNQLRIDIRCIKRPFNRVLVSRKAIIDSINVINISRAMTEISNQIKRVMEADFNKSVKTLAIVARPPSKLFSFKRPTSEDISITNEIVRATAQKLRLLTVSSTSFNYSENKILNLQILGHSEEFINYMNKPAQPSEILADLDADYLMLITYQDLGEKVRLCSDLHSFDSERPAVAIFINEEEIDKSLINDTINNTIINLIKILCDRGVGLTSINCDSVKNKDILNKIKEVKMHGILRNKQFGFRLGGVTSHSDTKLFLGRRSGNYFEAFYSSMLPFWKSGKGGGRFSGGIEVVYGLDISLETSRKRPLASNLFLNSKFILTPWQYSNTVFNFILGAGIGMQRITCDFSPGDPRFLGNENYLESAFVFGYNFFTEIEFPLWNGIVVDILFRYVPASETIRTFKDAPIENVSGGTGLVGKLGGTYLVGGIKYMLR